MLQVALDFKRLEDVLRIVSSIIDFDVRLEVGTPLIKSEGIRTVSILSSFGKPVVADMKTMDTGYLEVEIAAEKGADLVSILAIAPDATIEEAVDAGKDYGVEIIADLIGVEDVEKRAREVEKLGVDEILVHVGIDLQKRGVSPVELFNRVKNVVGVRLSVAGGLNPEKIEKIRGADVYVVGGYITKSNDPRRAVEELLKVTG